MFQKMSSIIALSLMLVMLAAAAVLMFNQLRSRHQQHLVDERIECEQKVKIAYLSLCKVMADAPQDDTVAELLSHAAAEYKKDTGPVPPFNSIYFDDDLSKWRDGKSHQDEIATYAHYQLSDGSQMLFSTNFAGQASDGPDRDVPNTARAHFITIDSATPASMASTQPAQSAP